MMQKYRLIKKGGIILFWLLLWQIAAWVIQNPLLFAGPWETFQVWLECAAKPDFYKTVFCSVGRIGGGLLGGMVCGCILAAVSYRRPAFGEWIYPLIHLMKTVPVASFCVLFLIWWGSSMLSVSICFLVVLPDCYLNLLEGLKSTDRQLLEMAKAYRLPLIDRLLLIRRPALRPFIRSIILFGTGMAWKAGTAAEVIGIPAWSVGERLYLAKISLDTARMFAWTFTIVLLGFLMEKIILCLWEAFCRYLPPVFREGYRTGHGNTEATIADKANVTIRLEHVSKSYGKEVILDNVSSIYEAGKIYELKEPSGSGKTTLFRLIAGLEKADKGKIVCSQNGAFLFQEDRLLEDYSSVINVCVVTKDMAWARKALEQLLAPELLDKPCRELSGGQRRRVCLVRAMEMQSDYCLLDEPFTGLDSENRKKAMEYIRKKQDGRTILMATHTGEELEK